MRPQFPQNAVLQEGVYTVTSKAEQLSPVVYLKHIRKYKPEYFLQEHALADFDLLCLLLKFLGDSLLFSQNSHFHFCVCLLHLPKCNTFNLALLNLFCFNWGSFPLFIKINCNSDPVS